ncbi:ribonuclease pancreatic-like, partial [Sander vitreus]
INMKISIFAGVLLLSAAVLSMDGDKVKHDVKWFTNQHIIEEMNEIDCTNVIKGREIMKDDGRCKWSNSFIIAPLEAVTAVCQTPALKAGSNLHESETTFDLVDCKQTMESARNKDKPPNCVYKKGELKKKKKIVIGCDKYGPVHLEKFL